MASALTIGILSRKAVEGPSIGKTTMDLSTQGILVILIVGLVANRLAGQIVRGGCMGIIADLAVGIVGAFIGSWLLPRIGLVLGSGILAAIVNATIGAIILLPIIRLVQGSGRLRRR
jgi:uncharacterized membrane protein YeaQ/YmgE (transglycosylase-associated protein family)